MPSRSRFLTAVAGLVTALVTAPILGAVALAADEVVVRPGDTLTAIARRHQVTIERIVELNRLPDANRIVVGQRLRLSGDTAASAPKPAPAPAATTRTHTVRSGEHLTGIARHYGTTIAAIAKANRLADPSRIYAGQRLTIPGAAATVAAPAPKPATSAPKPAASAPKPAPVPATWTHTVRTGEHLTGIARHYGTTIAAIAGANGLRDPSRIFAGQRLTIPPAAGAAPSAVKPRPAMPADMATLVAKRDGVRRVIVEEATRLGVPPALALAVAWQESGWRQDVVSSAGAVGVMQLLPSTGEWIGEAMLGTVVDIHDSRGNVRAGVRLLAHYLDRYDGNRDLVLAAYYQGQTAADRHGVYRVSRPYIASIKLLERLFGG